MPRKTRVESLGAIYHFSAEILRLGLPQKYGQWLGTNLKGCWV